MTIASEYPTFDQNIRAAELNVNNVWENEDTEFTEGFIADHETAGSWFTSKLTGLFLSQALDDETEQDLYRQRTGVDYGITTINETLAAFEALGKVRNFSQQEASHIKELQERKALIQRDLDYTYTHKGGDLDAVIDTEGQSFNDRWGYGNEDVDVLDFLKAMADNPKYTAGLLSGEIVGDLPLGILAWLGVTSKAAKSLGKMGMMTKLANKINGIRPKALRGLTKVTGPVLGGALAGATYEASYSKLNEGVVKGEDVKAGGEFGAVFGALSSLGILAKGVNLPKKLDVKVKANASISPSEAIDIASNSSAQTDITKFFNSVLNDESQVFPQLTPDDYTYMDRASAVKAGVMTADEKVGKGAFNRVTEDGKQTIVWGEAETTATFNRLQKILEEKSGYGYETLKGSSAKDIESLKNREAYGAFQLAHEKSHVVQNKEGRTYEASPHDPEGSRPGTFRKEQEAHQMAFTELNRLKSEYLGRKIDKSVAAAQSQADEYHKGKEYLPKDYDENVRGLKDEPLYEPAPHNSQVVDFVDKHKGLSTLGAALAAYGLTEGDDAVYMAGAAALATLGGPKAYRALSEVKISQEVAKARVQMATVQEGLSVYAHNLEIVGQTLGARISKRFPGEQGLDFLNVVEKGGTYKDVEGKALVTQWREWMKFLGDEGSKVGLFKKSARKGTQEHLVSNYVSHIIRGKAQPDGSIRPLNTKDKEELVREQAKRIHIKGSVSTVHAIPRQILGTLKDLKAKGYAVVDNPADVLSIYSQAMSRTIHNRKMIEEFQSLNLGTTKEPRPAFLDQATFDRKVFTGAIKKEEVHHYTTLDHPALRGYRVHRNLSHILDNHFTVAKEGGLVEFAEGLLSLNNALKRVFIFGSLFHSQALIMSAMYSMGITGAINGIRGKGKITKDIDYADLALDSDSYKGLMIESSRDGLKVGSVEQATLVNYGKEPLDNFLDKMGVVGAGAKKLSDGIDRVTWTYLHDRYKIAAHLRHKEILMRKGIDEVSAGKASSRFVNDAFGTLNWDDFSKRLYDYAYRNPGKLRAKMSATAARALAPSQRKWMNAVLFAPDWTIANLRIIATTFTDLPKVSKHKLNQIIHGKWESKEAKEIVDAYGMYRNYTMRAGFYTTGLWFMMNELFSDEESNMENFAEFWETGKLNLGGGETQVISKQLFEPISWALDPYSTFAGKTAIVPKTIIEGFTNKQWFHIKDGRYMGPDIVDRRTGETHLGKWALSKVTPIVATPFLDNRLTLGEKAERVGLGFIGFPKQGQPD